MPVRASLVRESEWTKVRVLVTATRPGLGLFANGVCTHACTTSDECKTESGNGECLPFNGSGNNCAIKCSAGQTRCPLNNLGCNNWGPYNLCGTWSLGSNRAISR